MGAPSWISAVRTLSREGTSLALNRTMRVAWLFLIAAVLSFLTPEASVAGDRCEAAFANGEPIQERSNLIARARAIVIPEGMVAAQDARATLLKFLEGNLSDHDRVLVDLFLRFKEVTTDESFLDSLPRAELWPMTGKLNSAHFGWNGFTRLLLSDQNETVFRSEADLEFLRLVVETAEKIASKHHSQKTTFFDAYPLAVRSWEQRLILSLRGKYQDQLIRMSHEKLSVRVSRMKSLIQGFESYLMSESGLPNGAGLKLVTGSQFMPSLRTHLANFPSPINDLIVEKFFLLFQSTKIPSEALSVEFMNFAQDYSHPKVFNHSAMEYANIASLTKFLKDNEYEPEMRIRLLDILDGALALVESRKLRITRESGKYTYADRPAFDMAFYRARVPLEQEDERLRSAPKEYELNLNIFSVKSELRRSLKSGRRFLKNPNFVQTDVQWCRIRGRPYSSYGEYVPLAAAKGSNVFATLKEHVKSFFGIYRENETLDEATIDKYEQSELNSPLERATFFVFTDPRTGKMKAMLRLFDGSPIETLGSAPVSADTFIEVDFSNVVLPERERGEDVFEVGRLGASLDILDGVTPLLARVAEFMSQTGRKGAIYYDALPGATKLYVRNYGAVIAYTPHDLGIPENKPQISIMRNTIEDFIAKHTDTRFRIPRFRKGLGPEQGRSAAYWDKPF